MTTLIPPVPATLPSSRVTVADQPQWGDLVKWQAAKSALRGAVETGRHLIGGMLPEVDATGRVSAASGLCMRCGSVLLVEFGAGSLGIPTISGKARREHCIPRSWWTEADASTRVTRRAFAARKDPAFVGYALAVYRTQAQARDVAFDLDRALGLHGINAGAALDRLALYPMPPAEARAAYPAVQEMARASGLDAAILLRVLDDARTAIAAEAGQRAVVAREMEIVAVRSDLARLERERVKLQERLDGLLAQGEE